MAGRSAPLIEVQATWDFLRKKRRLRRSRDTFPEVMEGDEMEGGRLAGTDLIPQSEAVTQALAAYPEATPLGVKLLPGPPPVYAVKLRVDGQVFRVHIDAQSAQILGQ
jgi:uncharacterized membrane protein YkoI